LRLCGKLIIALDCQWMRKKWNPTIRRLEKHRGRSAIEALK